MTTSTQTTTTATLKTVASKAGVTPKFARKVLRALYAAPEGGRWTFDQKTADKIAAEIKSFAK